MSRNSKIRARIAHFNLMVLYLRRNLAVLVPGRFERCRQTRKCVEAGMTTSKLLWFENIRKGLDSKPMKSDTLKIKQSFKSEVTFPCLALGSVSVCSTVFLLLLLFLFEIQLVSLVCDDSDSCCCFRTGNKCPALLPVKSLLTELCAGWSLLVEGTFPSCCFKASSFFVVCLQVPLPYGGTPSTCSL